MTHPHGAEDACRAGRSQARNSSRAECGIRESTVHGPQSTVRDGKRGGAGARPWGLASLASRKHALNRGLGKRESSGERNGSEAVKKWISGVKEPGRSQKSPRKQRGVFRDESLPVRIVRKNTIALIRSVEDVVNRPAVPDAQLAWPGQGTPPRTRSVNGED